VPEPPVKLSSWITLCHGGPICCTEAQLAAQSVKQCDRDRTAIGLGAAPLSRCLSGHPARQSKALGHCDGRIAGGVRCRSAISVRSLDYDAIARRQPR
jgi:hypothetical protein